MDTVGAVVEDLDVAGWVDRREGLFDVGVLVEVAQEEEVAQRALGTHRPRAALRRDKQIGC